MVSRWRCEGAVERIATGWRSFDEACRGGIVIGALSAALGAPNAGKTAVLADLTGRWAHDGVACGALCVDETPDDFLTRLVVRAGIDLDTAEARSAATLGACRT